MELGARHLTKLVVLLFTFLLSSDFAEGHVVFLSFNSSRHQQSSNSSRHQHIGLSHEVLEQVADHESPQAEALDHSGADLQKTIQGGGADLQKSIQGGESQSQIAEQKYPFIYAAHHQLARVLGKRVELWYHDWKLWVGLVFWCALWVKWVRFGYDEVYWERAFFAFGLNIVILHILQYSSSVIMGMFCVNVLLGVQAIAQVGIAFGLNERQSSANEFLCDTLYMDLSLPALQITVLFVSQCCVWWFYMTHILFNFGGGECHAWPLETDEGECHAFLKHVNYSFWLVAYLAMQMTMIMCRGEDSVLGSAFPVHDVHFLYSNCDKITVSLKDSDNEPFQISRMNIFMRGLTGFFCNAILREIMSYTIPLMLMGFSEPMDFVVYCVGVNFICTIDDMSDRTFLVQPKDKPEEPS